jgi:hypothetical protein
MASDLVERKAGRPAFEPTDEQRKTVKTMAGLGMRHEDIALCVFWPDGGPSISVDTLRVHFSVELATGAPMANASIGLKLFEKAMNGDTAALIFWAKTRMRWQENFRHEHSGPDGGPIQTEEKAEDLSHLTDDELAQLDTILAKARERTSRDQEKTPRKT